MSKIDDKLLALASGDVSSDEDEEMDMSGDGSSSSEWNCSFCVGCLLRSKKGMKIAKRKS